MKMEQALNHLVTLSPFHPFTLPFFRAVRHALRSPRRMKIAHQATSDSRLFFVSLCLGVRLCSGQLM
jgi:hypothetical protein